MRGEGEPEVRPARRSPRPGTAASCRALAGAPRRRPRLGARRRLRPGRRLDPPLPPYRLPCRLPAAGGGARAGAADLLLRPRHRLRRALGRHAPVFTPNPLAAGWPSPGGPVMIDVSMSITTNGMTARRRAEGTRFPHPALLDAEGRATDDPNAFFADPAGTLLPLGGMAAGHKGFGLGLLVEALTSALAGHGRADPPARLGRLGAGAGARPRPLRRDRGLPPRDAAGWRTPSTPTRPPPAARPRAFPANAAGSAGQRRWPRAWPCTRHPARAGGARRPRRHRPARAAPLTPHRAAGAARPGLRRGGARHAGDRRGASSAPAGAPWSPPPAGRWSDRWSGSARGT